MVLVHHLDGQKRILEKSANTEDVNCSVDATGNHWTCSSALGNSDIVCSLDSSGQSVSCEDRRYCPYSEETDRISLTVYIRSNYMLEEYSRHFYLSEIVKPDQVFITKVNNSTIEWRHPVSWNRPSSYFPLTFQVKVITARQRRRGCMCDSPCAGSKVYMTESSQWSVKGRMTVCIKAQDALCDSLWSDWKEYSLKEVSLIP
ncbi:hypothetical protein DPEC_G00020320 [Dallia pectoralis]|uniref:Uncharacterized protein n=1 Tax=Dallia pectoralis TaxID=75939 RepID=A0ACC2HFU3_DALPE|nr:hypothetical protein DPEC_G00020320 [Dallia pectoralis]